MSSVKLLSYNDHNIITAGIVIDNSVFNLQAEIDFHAPNTRIDGTTLDTAIRRWSDLRDILKKIENSPSTKAKPLENVQLAAPLMNPGTIYCAGANYYDHAEEMGNAVNKDEIEPLFFLKSCGSIIGPNDEVKLNNNYSQKYDWEVELAVIIGQKGYNLAKENALDIVAGYTIFNDVSARDAGRRTDWPFGMDWFRHKSFHTSAPIGPWIVPANEIENPQSLSLRTFINDEIMQEGNTKTMVFSVAELLTSISKQVPLMPGDVVATGTCAGVGLFRGIFLKPGDIMKLEIEGIGELINPVV